MHLTTHTDFGLRLLMYLHVHALRSPGECVSAREVAEAYDISVHHLAKVAQQLTQLGWVDSRRGRGGGLTLRPETATLPLGEVVRALESAVLVECFGDHGNCAIAPACRLKGVLAGALEAFYASLDAYTLADLTRSPKRLTQILLGRRP